MNSCPFCNNNVEDDSAFCPACGRSLAAFTAPGVKTGKGTWLKKGMLTAFAGLLVGILALWAGSSTPAFSQIAAKMGLSQGKAGEAFPVSASGGGCCAKPQAGQSGQAGSGCGGGGCGSGGGGCGSTGAGISDDEAYQAAESVMSYWAARYNQEELKIEALNKGCHVEITVFLKDSPLKSYKYVNGQITAI